MNRHTVPRLVDSHVHTDDPRLTADWQKLMQAARDAGVIAQIVPSITRQHWPRVKQVCAGAPELHAGYGLHPCFMDAHDDSHLQDLALWLGRERPVAVGECGLDYFIENADHKAQQHLFGAQLALAREFRLPIIIHARKAVEDVIRMIRESGHDRGVVHSFNGSRQQAMQLIDLGFHLGFGGAVTYARATRLRKLVASLPLDALLLETDAPDQVDAAHAGQRNEPAFLHSIWQSISELREESAERVAESTSRNAAALFGLDLPDTLPALSTESDPSP